MPRDSISDETTLNILHLIHVVGLSRAVVAERFRLSRGQASGLVHRCMSQSEEMIGPALDGTEAPLWWKDALTYRTER